jgi:hypothetical protein
LTGHRQPCHQPCPREEPRNESEAATSLSTSPPFIVIISITANECVSCNPVIDSEGASYTLLIEIVSTSCKLGELHKKVHSLHTQSYDITLPGFLGLIEAASTNFTQPLANNSRQLFREEIASSGRQLISSSRSALSFFVGMHHNFREATLGRPPPQQNNHHASKSAAFLSETQP